MKVIAIQNFGSSGSMLMHSYFDSHPDIISLPGLLGINLYDFYNEHYHLPKHEFIEKHIEFNRSFFEPMNDVIAWGLTSVGDRMNFNCFTDRNEYRQYIAEYLPENFSSKDFIKAVFISYNKALGIDKSNAKFLLFPIHSRRIEVALQLTYDFEYVYFLYTLRDPIKNIGSLIESVMKEERFYYINALINAVKQIFCDFPIHAGNYRTYGFIPYCNQHNAETRAIKLEDLHNNQKEIMEKVCKWIGLEWNECLRSSTFLGFKWWNLRNSPRVNGTNTVVIERKFQNNLNGFDRYRLGKVVGILSEYYPNYHKRAYFSWFNILPFKFERKVFYYIKRSFADLKVIFNFKVLAYILALPYLPIVYIKDYVNLRIVLMKAVDYQNSQKRTLELL